VANLQRIVAIELIVGARALELRAPLRPAEGPNAARAAIRALVPGFGPDRQVSPELREVAAAVADGRLLREIESSVGALA
jgi:histidine ammonia-lyase